MTQVGNYSFSGCNRLTTIQYHETEEQFNEITLGSENAYFENATVIYIED